MSCHICQAVREKSEIWGVGRAYAWSNAPLDVYAPHTHSYDKVIYVVSGSITFGLPELERNLTIFPGDRLDLPRGTLHDALVGREGVVCLEEHK